jgi:hypothetical protein
MSIDYDIWTFSPDEPHAQIAEALKEKLADGWRASCTTATTGLVAVFFERTPLNRPPDRLSV